MGFSLKKAVKGAVGSVVLGPGQALTGGFLSGKGTFDKKYDQESPEAAELRKIKMEAARSELESLKGFRSRMDATEGT